MRKFVAVAVLLGVLLSLCIQSVNPEEIKQKAIESSKNIKTYKFKMTIQSEVLVGNESSGAKSVTMSNITGAFDSVNKRMYMDVYTVINRFGRTYSMRSETYIINDTAYIKAVRPNGTSIWYKTKVQDDFWSRNNQIDQQAKILSFSKVEELSDVSVNSVDCYVLKLKPDLDKFIEYMTNSSKNVPQNKSMIKKMLKEVVVKEWIAKDTFYPVKAEILTVMEMPMGISIGSLKGNISIKETTKTIVDFYDYNKPVAIELPKEAKNATEV